MLAVMERCEAYVDDAAEFPEQFKPGVVKRDQREYRIARDDVAELIEADKAFDNACAQADAWPDDADLQYAAGYAMRRRAIALALAQGGAA